MFCPNCGRRVDKEMICPYCGQEIIIEDNTSGAQGVNRTYSDIERKNNSFSLIMILLSGIIPIAGFFIYFLIREKDEKTARIVLIIAVIRGSMYIFMFLLSILSFLL